MSELIARPWEWSREQGGDIVIHGPRYPDGGSTADIVLSGGAYLSEEEAALIVKAVNSHDKLVEALEDLLTVNPRPVKVPGTSMTLAISYTEGDLVKFTNAKAALEEAKP